jgi:prevent-host-death family protein
MMAVGYSHPLRVFALPIPSARLFTSLATMTTMTIMVRRAESEHDGDTWTVAEAKAKFSEVLDLAEAHGPQTVTRNGRRMAMVVSVEEWERKTKRRGNLSEFFASSPLRGSGLKLRRSKETMRKIAL